MNPEQHACELLDKLGVRHPCDVDLLVFFARHPRTLLASEQLAAFIGYDLTQIADSLELLIGGGFLKRTANSIHAARLYVFSLDGPHDQLPSALVQFVATREGRLTMKRALARRSAGGTNAPAAQDVAEASSALAVRPVLVRSKPVRIVTAALRTRQGGAR